jgi:glycosyltransferase involved in cell wall biosynthesis
MKYALASCDLTREAAVAVPPGCDGLAITLRHGERPVGFVLQPVRKADAAARFDVLPLVEDGTAQRLLVAAMREELAVHTPPASFASLAVTVAICTKDRPALVQRCLGALADLAPESIRAVGAFEILVIDNASTTDETQSIVTAHPDVRYVREPRLGLNFARNRALQEAKGDLVAYIDDDVCVDPAWLRSLSLAWLAHPQAGLFTGQVLPFEIDTEAQLLFEQRGGFRRGFERIVFGAERVGDPNYPCSVGLLGTGANMIVRRDVAAELGGFDTALDTGAALPGGGDLDMFYRLLRKGCRVVYEPACVVLHQHRRDMAGLRRQYRASWGTAFMAFAMKSWRADPPMRRRWTRMVVWWFGKQATHFVRRLVGKHPRPLSLIVGEAAGGVVGVLGAYGRSQRRVARIARNAG